MRTLSRLMVLVAWAGALAACCAVAGCGYSTGGLYRGDIQTVAVPIFQSREFRRGLEYEFTKELENMITLRTPYRLAAQDKADTVILGSIDQLATSVQAENSHDVVTEAQVTLVVSYQWKDLRTGKDIRGGERRYSSYYAPREGQTLRSAQTTAMRKLAQMIVEDMEKDW
jgi:hypothetical protein